MYGTPEETPHAREQASRQQLDADLRALQKLPRDELASRHRARLSFLNFGIAQRSPDCGRRRHIKRRRETSRIRQSLERAMVAERAGVWIPYIGAGARLTFAALEPAEHDHLARQHEFRADAETEWEAKANRRTCEQRKSSKHGPSTTGFQSPRFASTKPHRAKPRESTPFSRPELNEIERVSEQKDSMAERVGFEPTVPLRVHLISSQARSTELRHLSAGERG